MNSDGTLGALVRGDNCVGNNANGYYVDGYVTGIVTNDGQVTGVNLDGSMDMQPVGFDYNSGSSSSSDNGGGLDWGPNPNSGLSGGNSGDLIIGGYDVNTFFHGVLYGIRQPGESFGACMDKNIKETTGGTVDPAKLYNKALVGAETTAMALAGVIGPPAATNGLQLASYGLGRAAARLIGTTAVARPQAFGARAGRDALAIFGAATVGLTIGSAINCM